MIRATIETGSTTQRGAVWRRVASFGQFPRTVVVLCVSLLASLLLALPVSAQVNRGIDGFLSVGNSTIAPVEQRSISGYDASLLHWVNRQDSPFVSSWMESADATFYPITYASVPLYWGVSLLADDVPMEDALTFTAGWVATAGSTILLKRLARRSRPYVIRKDLVIRYSEKQLASLGDASSFPSGHTSMSVFLATYLAVESNTPPVRITGGLWATSVAISRVWNGVHYPTDILAGAILGSSVALLSQHFR